MRVLRKCAAIGLTLGAVTLLAACGGSSSSSSAGGSGGDSAGGSGSGSVPSQVVGNYQKLIASTRTSWYSARSHRC